MAVPARKRVRIAAPVYILLLALCAIFTLLAR